MLVQRLRLCAGGVLEFLLPGTVAKFIIKSSLLLLSLNKDFSARTMAEICTNAHCSHFSPACTKPMLVACRSSLRRRTLPCFLSIVHL